MTRLPLRVSRTKRPSRARCLPRVTSRMVPSARTTVSASTQSRVLPYLKVAAPAALVATIPPANAPVKVGTGANQAPSARNRSCIAATVTPGSTVMRPGATSTIRAIFVVAIIVSPIGVAPPVSEDCAPTTSTDSELASASTTSAVDCGKMIPGECPPGKFAASTSQSSVGSRRSTVISRQSESSVGVVSRQSAVVSRRQIHSGGVRPWPRFLRLLFAKYLISAVVSRASSSPSASALLCSSTEISLRSSASTSRMRTSLVEPFEM